MQKLKRHFPNSIPVMLYEQGGMDPRASAAHALGEIGPAARTAIPELNAATAVSDLNSSWYVRMAVKAALIKVNQEPLAPYIEQLKNTSNIDQWYQDAMMIGELGTNASEAVPVLVSAISPTNHPVVQAHAAIALGMIHSRPQICVPPLAQMLKSPDVALRQKAIWALPRFGRAAKPAWNEILHCLQDSDDYTRHTARDALKRIDPDAAKKEGIR